MARYRVSLFKNLLSSDGHPIKCLQCFVQIKRARSAERAIEAARWRYQRAGRMPDWASLADIIEAEETVTELRPVHGIH
jgi:hypothetical protein